MKSLNDLYRIEPELLEAIQAQVSRVIESGWFVLGKHVAEFEQRFASYIGVCECVGVNNGTDALEVALNALDLNKNSRVATVANAGFYSSTAILACGATPCYIDVDAETATMCVDHLESTLLQQKLDAVIVTHLYGRLARIEAIQQLCDRYQVALIEDCAQSHGAQLGNKKAGSFGKVSCFSFYPTKNLGAMGDGGAVCTDDQALAARVRSIRQYGWSQKYHATEQAGRNSRLDEIQASILSLKLAYLDRWNTKRRAIAQYYNESISNPKVIRKPQFVDEDYVAHLYVLQVQNRHDLQLHLAKHSIPHDVHYPIPDYRQQAYLSKPSAIRGIELKNTEEWSRTAITLPCFPWMNQDEIQSVVSVINGWVPQ